MEFASPPAPSVTLDRRDDGSIILRSGLPLGPVPKSLAHVFDEQAVRTPDAIFMRQRGANGAWRSISYGDARRAADGLAQWLIDRGIGVGDIISFLSEPSIEHGIAAIGVQRSGAAIAPVSVAYSLMSKDHAQLRQCVSVVGAKVVIVDDAVRYAAALRALAPLGVTIVAASGTVEGLAITPWAEAVATPPSPDVAERMDAIRPDQIARIIYTSGSTGSPKATPQPHANLNITIAQNRALGLLDFGDDSPQILEAMPFSHIMAGNFNFNNTIAAGGTIWIDDGKPTPELFARTLANLRDVAPSYFITVPLGYTMLCQALEADTDLSRHFFSRLKFLGFGGAVLAEDVRDRLTALSIAARGKAVPIFSFYGATEYLFGTLKYWTEGGTDVIGLPLPATDLKLVPFDGRYEMRVKGPTMMPQSGYIGAPEASASLFDEEGYFHTGDAVRFADPDEPRAGLVFAGRLSEDFKLDSGTYVTVEALRVALLAACGPHVSEAVICGLNRPYPSALLWLRAGENDTETRAAIASAIATFNASQSGAARRIGAALILNEPPSFETGEVTVKGNVAQRVVRERRSADVDRLYAARPEADVMIFADRARKLVGAG
ncbi:AMP-binding protein [Sphingopyxis terrae]|uniref:AMP-binding protein n=1 Tax=Sphingopyxis terrae TaxID=33052 RepID=UPI001C2C2994|nr:AMP-binding protein [Sphingopyxis terrae]QXF11328.1 AMP-binding protein [Sphingopyxis terrae subsp. terrae]